MCNKFWTPGTECSYCHGLTIEERFWQLVNKDGPLIRPDLGNCWVWTGAKFNHGYGQFFLNGDRLVHRIAFKLSHDQNIDGLEVDHRCRNIICCRPTHLRAVTHKQNGENKPRLSKRSTSGYRGVRANGNRWAANIGHNGKRLYIGLFATKEEAAEAIRLKRIELHTHNDDDRIAHG
jgi:hypothetical protein